MAKTTRITVTVTPTKGDTQVYNVDVTGPSVGHALTAARINGNNVDLTVNGKPATLQTRVDHGDKVIVRERISGS